MRCSQTTFVFVLQPCSEKRCAVSVCRRFPYLQGNAVRCRVLTIVLRLAVCWFFQNGERLQESNYMYSSSVQQKNQWVLQFGYSLITQLKNHNTQLTKKSVGITQFTKISYLELWKVVLFSHMKLKPIKY